MSPLQRAARAICAEFGIDPDRMITAEDDSDIGFWSAGASCLDAVRRYGSRCICRRPRAERGDGGRRRAGDWNRDNLAIGDEAKKVYTVMIDAMLKEG